jgi:hypothetical protein
MRVRHGMGFDVGRIPIVREAFRTRGWPLTDNDAASISIASNEPAWNGRLADLPIESLLQFRPHFGWIGEIEPAWRRVSRGA